MGFSKYTKAISGEELLQKLGKSKPVQQNLSDVAEKVKKGEGYESVGRKGRTLREQASLDKGKAIIADKTLTEEEKRFRMKQLINEQSIHKQKFNKDIENRRIAREKMLDNSSKGDPDSYV